MMRALSIETLARRSFGPEVAIIRGFAMASKEAGSDNER
jgi:hypothetical protein